MDRRAERDCVLTLLTVLTACGGSTHTDDGGTVDTTPPTVRSTTPPDQAVDVRAGTEIAIVFSEAIDPASVGDASCAVRCAGAHVAADRTCEGDTLRLMRTTPLRFESEYAVHLTAGITDLAGNALTPEFVLRFTTERTPMPPPVEGHTPAHRETDVAVDTEIWISVNADLDPTTLVPQNLSLRAGQTSVPTTIRNDPGSVRLTPTRFLDHGTEYTVRLTGGIRTAAGAPLPHAYSWSFTTRRMFGAPQGIESAIGRVVAPTVAADAQGNAFVIWGQEYARTANDTLYELWANRFDASTGWGTARAIGPQLGHAVDYRLAVDGQGWATAVWIQRDVHASWDSHVMTARWSQASGWSTHETLDLDRAGDQGLTLAVHRSGSALVVWGENSQVLARSRDPSGAWQPTEVVQSAQGGEPAAAAAIDDQGNTILVWSREVPPAVRAIWASRRTPGVGWSAPVRIDSDPQPAFWLAEVGVDAQGNAIAAWPQGSGLWVNYYAAGAGWAGAELVETNGGWPWLGVAPSGHAMLLFYGDGIRARRFVPGVGWSAGIGVGHGDSLYRVTASMDDAGDTVVVWSQTGTNLSNVFGCRLPFVGNTAEPSFLIGSSSTGLTLGDVDLGPDGIATVAWSVAGTPDSTIMTNRVPADAGVR